MIKEILFDLDNTVLDFTAAERASIRRAFGVFSLGECTDEMLDDYSIINNKHWEMLERREKKLEEVLVDRYAEFLLKYGFNPELAEKFNDEYETHIPDTIIFMPGAEELLKNLKGRVILCCATNGVKAVQEKRLKTSGLDKIFDYVFISSAMGVGKPSKEYFDRIFAETGIVNRDEALMVGDSLTSDMLGAYNAGIKKCLYNPKHRTVKADFPIEYETDNLMQLPEIAQLN